MKLDYVIALAGSIVAEHEGRGEDTPYVALARAVCDLLAPDKPCGWDASFVVAFESGAVTQLGDPAPICIAELNNLTPDEAAWVAVEVLRAVERARAVQL